LKQLAHAAGPALRKALADNPSPEARRQIEQLLDGLAGVDLQEVKVPAGVTVLEVQDLLRRYREQLKSDDPITRGLATSGLGGLARYADVVPELVEVLKRDQHEYVRRCAAGALSRLGKRAAPALPLLQAGLKDPDVNVRRAFEYAINQIESAQEERLDKEQDKRVQDLLVGISAFRKKLQPVGKK
jgi:HEAT repeat protein